MLIQHARRWFGAGSVLPQIVPFSFGEELVNQYDMVSTMCTVNKGDMPIDISWEFIPSLLEPRKPRKLHTSDGILLSRSSSRISMLSIDSVRDRHSGNYTCRAKNQGGAVEFTTTLFVNGDLCDICSELQISPENLSKSLAIKTILRSTVIKFLRRLFRSTLGRKQCLLWIWYQQHARLTKEIFQLKSLGCRTVNAYIPTMEYLLADQINASALWVLSPYEIDTAEIIHV